MANFDGYWRLTVKPDYYNGAWIELTDIDLEHIADVIKQGFTEGEIIGDK